MDWGSLAPVLLGGLLAALGGLGGQLWSAREVRARELRDREHERQVWAREQRYQTHVAFLQAFDRLHNAAVEFRQADEMQSGAVAPSQAETWALANHLTMLELVAEPATYRKAENAFGALVEYAYNDADDSDVDGANVRLVLRDYVAEVRAESNLGPLELPAPPGRDQP